MKYFEQLKLWWSDRKVKKAEALVLAHRMQRYASDVANALGDEHRHASLFEAVIEKLREKS